MSYLRFAINSATAHIFSEKKPTFTPTCEYQVSKNKLFSRSININDRNFQSVIDAKWDDMLYNCNLVQGK
jgi:hypothetical protein